MELHIPGRDVSLTPYQQELTERRIQYALNRFSSQVPTAHVTVVDINEPKGGPDIRCRFKVQLRKKREVLAGDMDVPIESAGANTADRISQSLARPLDRQRDDQAVSMSGVVNS